MKKQEESKLEILDKAVAVIKKGGVVIIPTDTVFGLCCLWNNSGAISRIQHIKASRQNFPVLISDVSQAHAIAVVNHQAQSLANLHWPGGLTLIVKGRKSEQKIGLRMPDSEVCKYIINHVGPIIGTSANFHGQPAPRTMEELDKKLIKMVDYVIGGVCEKAVESTVVDTTTSPIKVLRYGAVKLT